MLAIGGVVEGNKSIFYLLDSTSIHFVHVPNVPFFHLSRVVQQSATCIIVELIRNAVSLCKTSYIFSVYATIAGDAGVRGLKGDGVQCYEDIVV